MVNPDIWTRIYTHAVTVRTGTCFCLFLAGIVAEVCRRTTDIVDISLELLVFRHALCFFYEAFVAAGLDSSSLMKCNCTEGTCTKATSTACKAELDFRESRNSSLVVFRRLIIHRVPATGKRKFINFVEFFSRQRKACRHLDHKTSVGRLNKNFAIDGIGIHFLGVIASGKKFTAFFRIF